ncbi:MAG: hypothetical protein KH419_16255 [Clostridioides difficile]|nr:hypothetical protein [Clostridioides difficile]
MKENNNLEVLKTLQATLNIIVKNEEEAQEKKQGYKIPIGESKFRQLCHSKNKGFPCIWINNRVYIIKNKLDDWFIENANGIKL